MILRLVILKESDAKLEMEIREVRAITLKSVLAKWFVAVVVCCRKNQNR